MAYQFVATDPRGVPYGEIRDANPRSLRFPIRNTPSFTWAIDADHPQAQVLQDTGRTLVKVYDDVTGAKVLRLCGPVFSREKTRASGGGSIALVAAAPTSRLPRRLVGKSPAGASIGTALAMVDRGAIISQVIAALNSGSGTLFTDAGDTGIRMGAVTPSSSTYVGPWRYKPASEVLAEMAGTLDGPDWRIRATEPTADAVGVQLGLLDVAPFIGTFMPHVVWEFGTGRHNVAEWRDVGNVSALLNDAYSLPAGFPDQSTAGVLRSTDVASIADYGLNEGVVPDDLTVDALRQSSIDEHVLVRKVPTRVITFSPVAEDPDPSLPLEERRVPRLFVDYEPGDIVVFRAVERFKVIDQDGTVLGYEEVQTVNAYFRVYAVTLNFDAAGVATPELTLVSDENTETIQ